MNNLRLEALDPIKNICETRNAVTAASLLAEENRQISDIPLVLSEAIDTLNRIQRWFIRNPESLYDDIFSE